jgi:hypothetical protein
MIKCAPSCGRLTGEQINSIELRRADSSPSAGPDQIFKHFPDPKPAYAADWDELPQWQQETDADIFERIEQELHAPMIANNRNPDQNDLDLVSRRQAPKARRTVAAHRTSHRPGRSTES